MTWLADFGEEATAAVVAAASGTLKSLSGVKEWMVVLLVVVFVLQVGRCSWGD